MTEEKNKPETSEAMGAVSAETTAQTAGQESKKPKAKRPPRKRAPRKKAPVKSAAPQGEDAQTVATPVVAPPETMAATTAPADQQAAPGQEEDKPPAKRRSRKRSPRKRNPAKTAATQAGETAEETETPETTSEPVRAVSENRRKDAAKKPAATPAAKEKEGGKITYKLLINADEPEECRIALLENGKVESFNVETVVQAQTKGNIYKGIITAIEPNLQAAFVDLGTGKNGFLAFGDIHPEYYCKDVGSNPNWKSLNIQDLVMKGQEVLVEVVKETTGNKGANITTYLSMPGRYIVLMPGSDSHGISRQINDEERRAKLREIIESAKLPEEIGYIIRTASEDVTKTALMQDINYQLNLWNDIKEKGQTMKAPALVYKEQDVVSRFLRDHFTTDIEEILVDNEEVFAKINDFMQLLPARQRTTKVHLHKGSKPIFNQYQVEEQIELMYQPTVPLPSGGSIVINPTEALVAIDVNSGRTSKDKNFEKTIFLANMEAADELARQLRLRDLGGLIVVDFIDMRDKKNIREVEKRVAMAMKKDKAKVDTSRISKFGLMQISRQRLGPPIQKGNYILCEHCLGHGMVKSVETTALALMRRIQTAAVKRHITAIHCDLPLKVAQYLLNQKRAEITELEQRYKVEIRITANPSLTPAQGDLKFIKSS